MKNLLKLSLLLLFSCNKSVDYTKVYSWEEYSKAIEENPNVKIEVVDTICPFETKRAKHDIEKNNLTYYSYGYNEDVVNELNLLLKQYKIKAAYKLSSCISPPSGFTDDCYEDLMNVEITKRYGEKWIDSLERTALINHIVKNPTKPYFENGIDLRTKYLKK